MATKNASRYDGTNDYARRGADLTGNADSKMFTFSIWFKRGVTGEQQIWQSSGNMVQIRFEGTNLFRVAAKNAGYTTILDVRTSAAITDTASWHNVMGSFDLSSGVKRHLYVDGVSDLSVVTYTNDTIDFTVAEHSIAERGGSFLYNGDLSEFWLDFGVYVDLSVSSNRDKFYLSGKAPNLGSDGSTPTGSSPLVYAPDGDPSTNPGTGGAFTVTGSLVNVTGPEAVVTDHTIFSGCVF